jgi:hypothetical protein
MRRIPIARPTTESDMNGFQVAFTEEILKASAAAYDPDKHEAPIVIGHPRVSDPAFGWVERLEYSDGLFSAIPKQVNIAFAEMVSEGAFKKRSARFYTPDAPRNPVPGVYYLRDIGFLGAAAPAIKGLPEIEFAESDEDVVCVEFAEGDRTIAMIFQGLRDWLIEQAGVEKASQVIPSWALEEIQFYASKPLMAEVDDVGFTEMGDLTEREQELSRREAALLQKELEAQRREFVAFAEGLRGRIHPAKVGRVVELMMALNGTTDQIEFAEGDGDPVQSTALEAFKELLKGLPEQVEFAEVVTTGSGIPADRSPAQIASAAQSYIAEQSAKGVTVSAADAVRAVS